MCGQIDNDLLFLALNFELNEYGIVYYITKLNEDEDGLIWTYEFIIGIDKLLQSAEKLYTACSSSVTVEIITELEHVLEKRLSTKFRSGRINNSDPICYTSEVFASTSKPRIPLLREPNAVRRVFFHSKTPSSPNRFRLMFRKRVFGKLSVMSPKEIVFIILSTILVLMGSLFRMVRNHPYLWKQRPHIDNSRPVRVLGQIAGKEQLDSAQPSPMHAAGHVLYENGLHVSAAFGTGKFLL